MARDEDMFYLYKMSTLGYRADSIEREKEPSSRYDTPPQFENTVQKRFAGSPSLYMLRAKYRSRTIFYHEYHWPLIPCTGLSGSGTQTFSFLCFNLLASRSSHCLTRVASSLSTMLSDVQGVRMMYTLPRAR
jgi:hypothetical protein